MREFIFEKRKYGFELLMDLHKFEGNPHVFFDPDPHIIDFFEIMIFENANGRIELNGHLHEIGKNNFFFISPFQKKSCDIRLEGVKGFHLVFQNDFLADFFDDKLFTYRLQFFYNSHHPQYLQLDDQEYQLIQLVLNEIITEIGNYQNDSPHILRSLLYFSLTKLNRLYAKQYQISSDTSAFAAIYQFKELMETHIREYHSVEDYCALLGISRHQLNSMTKEHFGSTSKEAIDKRLLQEIKMELRYTDKTINEISFELNFSEANNLTRFFRKHENLSPTSYRESYQKDSN